MGDAEMIERVGIRSGALPLLGDMPERLNIREIEAIIRREIAAEEGDA